jgi:hypothetical protein
LRSSVCGFIFPMVMVLPIPLAREGVPLLCR